LLSREDDGRAKAPDKGREMYKEVKLWLEDQNAGGTLSCDVQEILDAP
jgi:hypothetical protein